jgi:hypothetical protein
VTFRHRLNLSFFAMCLLIVGAFGKPTEATPDEHPPTSHEGSPAELTPANAATNYPLTVVFSGLIAWYQDGNKLWALVPNSCYKPENVKDGFDATQLPPGVFAEAMKIIDVPTRTTWLEKNFPPHCLTFNIENATTDKPGFDLTKHYTLDKGILALKLASGFSYLNLSLGSLSSAEQVIKTLDLAAADATATQGANTLRLDIKNGLSVSKRVDPLWLGLSLPNGFFLPAVITDPLRSFSYRTPQIDNCTTASARNPELLAEEAVFQSIVPHGSVQLNLDGVDQAGNLKPEDISKVMTIHIGNQTEKHSYDHLEAYRWFYNLTNANLPLNYQHYPCEIETSTGGNKCPQVLLRRP